MCQNLRGSDAFDEENCEKACLSRPINLFIKACQSITPISVRSIFTLTYYYTVLVLASLTFERPHSDVTSRVIKTLIYSS